MAWRYALVMAAGHHVRCVLEPSLCFLVRTRSLEGEDLAVRPSLIGASSLPFLKMDLLPPVSSTLS